VLPKSLDSESLQRIAIGVLIGLAVLSFIILRFVQKIMLRVILLVIVIGLGAATWAERVDLSHCAQTCSCRLFGRDVHVPRVGCDKALGN
jgi:hypothetical protein